MIRAIQFSNKRVGSTFLQKAIDSHPDIAGIDEVFVNMARKPGMKKSGFTPFLRSSHTKPQSYIEKEIYKKYPNTNTIFKLMYNQIEYHKGLMSYIKQNNIPIIHVIRFNLVKQVISGMTAASTEHNPVVINPKDLLRAVDEAHRLNIHWSHMLHNHIKLTVYYEGLFGETVGDVTFMNNDVNAAVCNFFGVPNVRLFARTKKKNKDNLGVYLPNIDEIREVFKGTEFEWMID
jgi:hypothetical protein